ncbi:LysM peptidoglycan-binding domain-containing protein [Heyndrickxia acidicola]|uniref:LysM peptidoglycan-binding domain-containing protein n=1 Tax=Heyndrickxia acidicola TaxID=209389 RepID=A0ABU6MBL3_9BACI|nr:LysM peptidoglycan-binding domain-containing protein [Heyndrickxia acidicola]MED1201905.1 LysM peptidoglycan-binding domain-containing protein [Heyndrickxia acidicola]
MTTYIKNYSYAILFIVISFLFGIYVIFSLNDDTSSYERVVVKQGQSIWEIASIYENDYSMSTQQFIKWVQDHNNIDSETIKEGDILTIPVKMKKEFKLQNKLALKTE